MVSPATVDARTAIVEAAATLLHDGGAAAVTTRSVARSAGVQAPTIYRLFGDKDGLLDAVAEYTMDRYVSSKTAKSSADDTADPLADLRLGWQMHIEFGLDNPDVFFRLNRPGSAERSAAQRRGMSELRSRVARLAAAGLLRVDEERAVAMIHAAGTGVVTTALAASADGHDAALADTVFEAIAGAISTAPGAEPYGGALSVAIAFATVVPGLAMLSEAERQLMSEWVARAIAGLS